MRSSCPLLVVALLMAFATGACATVGRPSGDGTWPGGNQVIDTWPVGDPLDCPDSRSCAELVRVGLAGIDERNPGHAPVVATRLHLEGALLDPSTGNRILMIRSGGCCHVLVVQLADGSFRAIGVGYPGISDEAVAIPWEAMVGG